MRAAERADCGTGGWSPWWSSGLSLHTAWCRCPGGREAYLQQCSGQFARPFAELCGCQRCCFQTRRWCSRSGCSPQCRSRMIWGCWGSFQTSSAVSGRRGADVPSSALHLCEQTMWDPQWCGRNLTCLPAPQLSRRWWWVCVFSALPPEIHHQLLYLVDVEWEVVLLTPFSQGTHLLSVGRLIVVGDQAYHRCVICKFEDDVGAVCGCTIVCVQGVEELVGEMRCCCPFWPPDFCLSGSPGSSCTEICLFIYLVI